jgi:hypothetical protein
MKGMRRKKKRKRVRIAIIRRRRELIPAFEIPQSVLSAAPTASLVQPWRPNPA